MPEKVGMRVLVRSAARPLWNAARAGKRRLCRIQTPVEVAQSASVAPLGSPGAQGLTSNPKALGAGDRSPARHAMAVRSWTKCVPSLRLLGALRTVVCFWSGLGEAVLKPVRLLAHTDTEIYNGAYLTCVFQSFPVFGEGNTSAPGMNGQKTTG